MDVKERMKGIGGSDVAPILGLSSFMTALDVWKSKIEEQTETEFDPCDPKHLLMHWGKVLEEPTLQQYERKTGNKVIYGKDIEQLVHPEKPWHIANIDGFAFLGDEKIILEAKYTQYGWREWGEEWTGDIPVKYACQVQHYMYVAGLNKAHIALWVSGDVKFYCVERKDSIINAMVIKLDKFWHENVLKLKPPEPQTLKDVKAIYYKDNGAFVTATDEILTKADEVKSFDIQIKELKSKREKNIVEIGGFMKDNARLTSSNGDTVARFATRKDGKRIMKII